MTGDKIRVSRNLLIGWSLLSLCLIAPRTAEADGPIQLLSSTTRNGFPDELFFDIAVADDESPIVSIQLIFRERGEPSDTFARLDFDPGRRVEATYRWNTKNISVPPGIPIEYHWVIVDEVGNQLRTDPETVYYDDVRFSWHVLENDEVAVFWHAGGEQVGQKLFDSAVAALQRLSEATGAAVEYPIRIIMYANREAFRSAFPYLNQWVGGEAFSRASVIVGYAEPGGSSLNWAVEQVIPHEISHVLFFQATFHPHSFPPRWLNEGLAILNEARSHSEDMALVRQAVQRGELLSLAEISGGFPADEQKATLSYAESLSVVGFILERYGADAMAAFLEAFKNGKATEAAVDHAFGLSLEELENAWGEYLSQLSPPETQLPPLPVRIPRSFVPTLFGGGLLCCAGVFFVIVLVLGLVVSKRLRT
ncbi:MAG: hypothetical protein JSW37_02610 [Anaerolineales bacterium]|nr:MAG: hypothetical protein JSW37_02610 [Anaerolineales bacterium]